MNMKGIGDKRNITSDRSCVSRSSPLWQALRDCSRIRQSLNKRVQVPTGDDRIWMKMTECSGEKFVFELRDMPIDARTFVEPPYHGERAKRGCEEKKCDKVLLTIMRNQTGLQYLCGYNDEKIDLEPLAPGRTELNRHWEVTEPKLEDPNRYYRHIFQINKFDLQKLITDYLSLIKLT
jgi:hypothetical protein